MNKKPKYKLYDGVKKRDIILDGDGERLSIKKMIGDGRRL